MDFSKFDMRGSAEKGRFVGLVHPFTGEPIEEDGKTPGFIVRGVAAKSVQSRLAEMQKPAKDGEVEVDDEDTQAVMERMHQTQVDAAMPYIIKAVDIQIGRKSVGQDEDAIRAVLDMTFPELKPMTDEKGEQITREITGENGQKMTVPRFEVVNKTFAAQVIEAAEDGARFLEQTADG